MGSSDDTYTAVMLEEIRDQNKAVLEAVGQMQDKMTGLVTKDELRAVADDVKVIKAAVAGTNKDLADHECRITALAQAA